MASDRRSRILPRMLTKDQAAEYCGVSAPTFERICPVRPCAMSDDVRLNRYDIRLLDIWLDSFGPTDTVADDDFWIDKMRREGKHAASA